ncbi:uncharacterized protein LOC130047642 [Ostrea edulis]|uniref:uncharacterized protein LOC130047642 n=1 Tax=Ostrea edulis TaxID=37623 RepID=UPI0024AFFBEE|nr:uncharacterized protein LOC130047642 [Ostrea edulis]
MARMCVIVFSVYLAALFGYTSANTQIWEIASSKLDSTTWSVKNDWRGDGDYTNKWKCNLFVYDVLLEANVKAPKINRRGHNTIGANEWANPQSEYVKETGCYETVSDAYKQKGDVIAFGRRSGTSGHMGIVSINGSYISAGEHKVTETSINGFLQRNTIVRTAIWRYSC